MCRDWRTSWYAVSNWRRMWSGATPTDSRPWNRLRCKTCPIHHPANSFTSSRTNVTYPITTHANCKSINLIYQLQCTECNAFYIGETRRSLSDHMNGHWFTATVLNPDLPVAIHTQSHQIPFQECWSVSVIHKLPDSTPNHIRRQFEIAYQLLLQSWHTPDSTSVNPPHSTLASAALKVLLQSPVCYC